MRWQEQLQGNARRIGMKHPTRGRGPDCTHEKRALPVMQEVVAAECGVDELALPATVALAFVDALAAGTFCQR